ncbi:MAG: CDP-diacylglycerol--glycerol-3-phosphate 3-phosphatidyltransferase [Pseudomonadota bacterium]
MNIPNSLTLLRVILIPIFVVFFYLETSWAHIAATFIFWLAALTDFLDGYLARKLNQSSAFGAFLDPVADKLIVAVALIILVDKNPTPYDGFWMSLAAMIIIGREITISALREWMAEMGARNSIAVSIIGKVKTTAQMMAILFLIYADSFFGLASAQIGFILLYLSVLLTLWSMIDYLLAAWPKLMHEDEK